MDSEAFKADLNALSSTLDRLEASLGPLLSSPLSANSSKIPLLDKAKLYTLTTYAIESLLFSCVRLNGIDAKDHAIYNELARIKQYFDKIKAAENASVKPSSKLDKGAAGRFVQHALASNERQDRKAFGGWTGTKRKLDSDSAEIETEPHSQRVDSARQASGKTGVASDSVGGVRTAKSSKKHKPRQPRGPHEAFQNLVKDK